MSILHDVNLPKGKAVPVKLVEGSIGGGGDMLKEVYDTNDDGKVDAAEAADSVPWDGVTGKPSTFPPAGHNHDDRYYTEAEVDDLLAGKADTSHTHSISQVSGLQSALDEKAAAGHGHAISDITDLQAELDAIKARLDALEGGEG